MRDKNEALAKAMIELFEAFEEYDTAQFYRKGEEEWRAFVRKFEAARTKVSAMDSET